MAERTGIAWTNATWNPVWGCQRVSPGCDHCYAEAFDKRVGGAHWGAGVPRRRTGKQTWNMPRRLQKQAERDGIRRLVFCASMADFFDNAWEPEWRADAWDVIRACPMLDWQLLTKRPQNIPKMLPQDWGEGWPNVWLGTTVENQEEADRRIPHLLKVSAAVRFLSCEPLLEPVKLMWWDEDEGRPAGPAIIRDGGVTQSTPYEWSEGYDASYPGIDWVICGGESGAGARPMRPEWARDLLDQCRAAGIAAFFKQVGSRHEGWPAGIAGKGDDPAQWPEWCRVQEFPHV